MQEADQARLSWQRAMRSTKKRLKKSKHGHSRDTKEDNRIVTCTFSGNQYIGALRQDSLGARSLDGPCERYTWSTGVHYEGPFAGSEVQGKGTLYWPDGSKYEGEISNGRRHGDGIYLAADGVTRYEGQWQEGKRHGHGRLSYDVAGEACYEGQWQGGAKHGQGRQVWPSRNVYEGQWRYGRMAGQGTMTWFDSDLVEQYRGNWEDDHPEGQGTHTWYAPDPTQDHGPREMPSQQMNNRYEGGWHDGIRHGQGTFSYASGARFQGAWVDNVKQGDGRYTFEDGCVYSGPFENDHMTARSDNVPVTANGRPLNIGNEDNPVRRCIDISDLEPLALPVDVGPHNFDIGSGYDKEHEVMREVYNMLLRYLGELKQFYAQYRAAISRPGSDPFVLSAHQLWVFCRDLGLITPGCSLSRLNRGLRAGPRHHQESAYEDLDDLRPLTPRAFDRRGWRSSLPSAQSSEQLLAALAAAEPEASEEAASEPGAGAEVEESSVWSSTQNSRGTPETVDEAGHNGEPGERAGGEEAEGDQAGGGENGPEEAEGEPALWSRSNVRQPSFVHEVIAYPLYSKFWREEGAPNLVNVHDPAGLMIFRHFLESIVRMSVSRYPFEKGLEHQLRRLFKEAILPNFCHPASLEVFAFVVDGNIQQVLEEFQPKLWQLFKENATGEGAYDRPQWISLVEVEQPKEEAKDPPEDNEAEEVEPCTELLPPLASCLRRGFGGQQRRVHLRARLDVTLRVKDVLKIFDTLGLLQPLSECGQVPEELPCHEPLFPLRAREPSTASSPMGKIDGLQGLEDMLIKTADIGPGTGTGQPDLTTGASTGSNLLGSLKKTIMATRSHTRSSLGSGGLQSSTSLDQAADASLDRPTFFGRHQSDENLGSQAFSDEARAAEAGEELEASEHQAAERDLEGVLPSALQESNLTTSFFMMLSIALEVCLPEAAAKLHWALTGEDAAQEERVALLDYLETELCYTEFLRILLRVADLRTEQLPTIGGLPLHKRFGGFMRHIFMPALQTPYPGPRPKPEPQVEESEIPAELVAPTPTPVLLEPPRSPRAGSRAPSKGKPPVKAGTKAAAAASPKAASKAHTPVPEPEEPPEPPQDPGPPPRKFWRGFDEDGALDAGGRAAPRHWPLGYEQEINDW